LTLINLQVAPKQRTLVCFPGDTFQLLCGGQIPATAHKVALSSTERFSFAYFHDPNFNAVLRPLVELAPSVYDSAEERRKYNPIHYGTYFTHLLMSTYPERNNTKLLLADNNRLGVLAKLSEEAFRSESAL
jgi:isopenicillin N synthase-like dioxygenase